MYITIQTACFEQWDLVLTSVNNVTPCIAAQTPHLPRGRKGAQDPHLRILLQQRQRILANLVEIDHTSK